MSNTNSTTPATKPQPVIITMSITTALAAFFGGLTLVAGLNDNPTVATIAGAGTLVVAAINQGLAYYTRGQVVPLQDTGSFLNDDRTMVAGPAAAVQDGVEVNVTAADAGPQGLT